MEGAANVTATWKRMGDVAAGMGMGDMQDRGTSQDGVMTKQGWFSWDDLGKADARLGNDCNGNRVIQFPVAYERLGNGQMRPIYRDIPDEKLVEGERT